MPCENCSKPSDYQENRNKSTELLRRLPKSTLRPTLVSSPETVVVRRIGSKCLRLTAEINSQDATYVLSYSVIMLNTDLHNPQVRKRMDLHAYSRNLRGVNENKDFDPEYLVSSFLSAVSSPSSPLYLTQDVLATQRAIYESIRKREIVLPEEHQNSVGFEYGWKELLRRTRRTGK